VSSQKQYGAETKMKMRANSSSQRIASTIKQKNHVRHICTAYEIKSPKKQKKQASQQRLSSRDHPEKQVGKKKSAEMIMRQASRRRKPK
jgi:hypothetical protein